MKQRLTRWVTSLTAKYVAIFVLLVAVPAIGISWYLLDSSYNDNKRALMRLQREKAESLSLTVEQYLDTLASELGRIHGQGVSGVDLANELSPFGADENLYVSGKHRIVQGGSITSAELRPLVHGAETNATYFGPSSGAGADAEMWVATIESAGPGVVGLQINLQFLDELLKNTRVGRAGYAWAVDPRGLTLSYPTDVFGRGAADPARLPQARRALASSAQTGATIGRGLRGHKLLSAWAVVPDTGWRIFVEQPESAAFAPLTSKIWKTSLLIALFVLVAIALSILLARRLVRPIKRMQVAAEAIGAGAYDERIELKRKDELGALASAFNHMAEHLQELIGGLERLVAERTRQLTQASAHKSEFLANMSHELRTPLNAILGFTQVLQQKLFGEVNPKQEEYLEDIHSSASHLLELINDVLDLSKVEAGQVELEKTSFSLREALERGVVMLRERATKNGVSLTLETDPDVELVTADERRIRQVVFNLVSNAVKFTPQGGRVDVRSAQQNGEVLVSVSDTGPGIAEEDQERIFQEFQQTELGAEQKEGTGLGLALSRKLVELHGGRIWVESAPAHGSTFTFTLPVEAKT